MPTQSNVPTKVADLPEVPETFGDTVRAVWFDGSTWRIDLGVTRLDPQAKEGVPMATTQYPSARLVLSAGAGLQLFDRLTELVKELEANGQIQRNVPPKKPTVTH